MTTFSITWYQVKGGTYSQEEWEEVRDSYTSKKSDPQYKVTIKNIRFDTQGEHDIIKIKAGLWSRKPREEEIQKIPEVEIVKKL